VIKVSVMYPSGDGATFDIDYYVNKHIPMVVELVGPALHSATVDAGLGGREPGGPPPYLAIAHLVFDSVEDFQNALIQISNSTIVALDELWSVSDSTGDAISLLDTLPDRGAPDPEQLMDQSELRDRIADAIAALPEREKLVVALYYYENLTLREIGEVLGVTESRVSQLHTKAVLRLRSKLAGELD